MATMLNRIGITVAATAVTASLLVGYGLCREAEGAPPAAVTAAANRSVPPMVVGMNLGRLAYWSAEWPFNDLVTNASDLMVVKGPWVRPEGQIQLDATGHPINIPVGTQLVVMLQGDALKARTGTYRCRISPGWNLRPFGQLQIEGSGTSFTVKIPDNLKQGALILRATTNGANLTNLSCTTSTALLNPAFLDDNRPFRVLRFMDWMATNGAPYRDWAKRPTPESLSQNGNQGVAVEYMVEVANTLKADPWFNMPLNADPSYYRQFAIYVRDHLSRDRKVYVELSNEVWNTAFPQARDAIRDGQSRYAGANLQQASDWYYGDRVRELMAVWTNVFQGQESRLVRVLASQSANPRRAEQALSHGDTWKSVDALATAPYFGISYNGPAAPGAARVNAIFAQGPAIVNDAIRQALAAKAVANRFGLRYVAYEAGPGFTANNNPSLAADNFTLARDPRMYDLYTQFLNRWRSEVGDLIVLFDSVSNPNNYGYFAHKEYTGQPLAEAPKMRAAVDAAQ